MGYRIFELCLMQVWRNKWVAARISWFWFLIVFVCGILMGVARVTSGVQGAQVLLASVVMITATLLGVTAIAVCWHRYVLLEETPDQPHLLRPGLPIGRYLWNSLRLGFVLFLVAFLPLFVFFSAQESLSGLGNYIVSLAVGTFSTWLFLRVGLILPAVAVDKHVSIRESFRLTTPLSGQLVVTALLLVLLQSAPGIVEAGGKAVGVDLSVPLIPVHVLFFWTNLFVGIGVLTVLYGHLCDGRPI